MSGQTPQRWDEICNILRESNQLDNLPPDVLIWMGATCATIRGLLERIEDLEGR